MSFDRTVYSAFKAALARMTQGLVPTLADRQIPVNIVCPGPIETAAWSKIGMSAEDTDAVKLSPSWPRRRPPMSTAPNWWSTAASWRCEAGGTPPRPLRT